MPFFIFGADENARVMYNYIAHEMHAVVLGLVCDKEHIPDDRPDWLCSTTPIVEFKPESLLNLWNASALAKCIAETPRVTLPIGSNILREEVFNRVQMAGCQPWTITHQKACLSYPNVVGEGSWIQEHCNIQSGVRLGRGVICWASAHIGHSSEIDDFCWITTNATICGSVKMGKHTFVAGNAFVSPGVVLAPKTYVGAGAVVTKDSEEGDVFLCGQNVKSSRKSWDLKL